MLFALVKSISYEKTVYTLNTLKIDIVQYEFYMNVLFYRECMHQSPQANFLVKPSMVRHVMQFCKLNFFLP